MRSLKKQVKSNWFIQENLYEKEVEIVTGYSHRMKELVQEVLSDYNLIGEEPQFNDGTLIVKIVWKPVVQELNV